MLDDYSYDQERISAPEAMVHHWDRELAEFVEEDDPVAEVAAGGVAENPNKATVRELLAMAQVCDAACDSGMPQDDKYRAKALKLAALKLKGEAEPIQSKEQVDALMATVRGVGKKTVDKVVEAVTTGKIKRLEDRRADPLYQAVSLFMRIYGIGPSAARELFQGTRKGATPNRAFRTLEELQEPGNPANLNTHQLWWLAQPELMGVGANKLPRREVEDIRKQVVAALPAGFEVTACGSYRRGLAFCSDVDLLITHPDGESHRNCLHELVQTLRTSGCLTYELAAPTAQAAKADTLDEGWATWKGCFRVEQLHRRVDVVVVPYRRKAPALIYFTGSGLLCRHMRGQAMAHGMRLNEKRLVDLRTNAEIALNTERDVFEALGMDWLEPHDREKVDRGFHYLRPRLPEIGGASSSAAAAVPSSAASGRARQIFICGDANVMGWLTYEATVDGGHSRTPAVPAEQSFAQLLQKQVADSGCNARVVIGVDGRSPNCKPNLDNTMLSVATETMGLRPSDIVLVATQLNDRDLVGFRGGGVGWSQGQGRNERLDTRPHAVIDELLKRGVVVVWAKVDLHPELRDDQSNALRSMYERFHAKYYHHFAHGNIHLFSLFEDVPAAEFARAPLNLGVGSGGKTAERYLPQLQAHAKMAASSWKAIQRVLGPPDKSSGGAGADSSAPYRPPMMMRMERKHCLALSPLGINEAFKMPVASGATIAIAAIQKFLSACAAPALRIFVYTANTATAQGLQAAVAKLQPPDSRLELVLGGNPRDISMPLTSGRREVGTVVHECNRRLSQLLVKAGVTSGVQDAAGGKAELTALLVKANQGQSTTEVGAPVLVSIPTHAPIKSVEGVQYLIAVRPPNMNEDKSDPLDLDKAQEQLARTYKMVLQRWASHVGLQSTL